MVFFVMLSAPMGGQIRVGGGRECIKEPSTAFIFSFGGTDRRTKTII